MELTNEKISKKFKSQFELVNYAIRLAENMILTGREARVRTDSQNHALLVVAEISYNRDRLEQLLESVTEEEEENEPQEETKEGAASHSEKRKARKIMAG
jgi:DNA-directed RNA polymerase subunit omega